MVSNALPYQKLEFSWVLKCRHVRKHYFSVVFCQARNFKSKPPRKYSFKYGLRWFSRVTNDWLYNLPPIFYWKDCPTQSVGGDKYPTLYPLPIREVIKSKHTKDRTAQLDALCLPTKSRSAMPLHEDECTMVCETRRQKGKALTFHASNLEASSVSFWLTSPWFK